MEKDGMRKPPRNFLEAATYIAILASVADPETPTQAGTLS
jgi:hypothetical protein